MKNKNTHIKTANYLYSAKLELFESKFVFLQARLEDDSWEEDTSMEKGISESRSVLDEFDTRYNPLDALHRVNSVEDTVAGVRDRLMQGVFNNLNVLSGGAILAQRVEDRYLNIVASAPNEVKDIIDREVRRRGGPGIETWTVAERKQFERQVAADLFTHEQIPGANYDTLVNNIQTEIGTMGIISPILRDADGQQIDLALPNATNEYIVQGGQRPLTTRNAATGAVTRLAGEDRVVIKWHEEDFATIRNKCEKAGIWATLQDNSNEFLLLKMRHSLSKRILMEEKAKLSTDRFSPERLKRWMANDWTRQAFQEDDEYRTWLTNTLGPACQARGTVPAIRTIAELQRLNPTMYLELRRQQQGARDRIGQNSLENQLTNILPPHELEDLSKSEETRTLLAYLYHKFQDDIDGPDVRKFIKEKAGVVDKEAAQKRITTLNTAEDHLKLLNGGFPDWLNSRKKLGDKIADLNVEKGHLTGAGLNNAQQKRLVEIDRQLEESNGKLDEAEQNIIKTISRFRKIMEDNLKANGVWGVKISTKFPIAGFVGFANNTRLKGKPIDSLAKTAFIDDFLNGYYTNINFRNGLEELQNGVLPVVKKKADEDIRKGLEIEEKGQKKIDSRSLLFELVQRDLKEKGVTDENRLQRLSVITTNMLVSKVKNTSVYGDVNQTLADRIELRNSSWFNRTMKSVVGVFDTNPATISGTDAIKAIVRGEPELNMFRGMNLNSSRADMIKMMNLHGKPSVDTLRRFQKKLAEFIKGLEVPVEKGIFGRSGDWMREKFTWSNKKLPAAKRLVLSQEDAVFTENTIHILQQLESELDSERIVNNVRAEVRENGDANAADAFHEYLESQTETNIATTKRLADELEPVDARFKRLTIRKNVQEEIDATRAANDNHVTEEEWREKGLDGFFFNKAWSKIKSGTKTVFTSPYSPMTWPVYVPYKIGKGVKDYVAPNFKEFVDEWKQDLERAKPAHKGLFWRPVKQAVQIPAALAVWALRLPQRILGVPINDPHVMRTRMRDL